MVKQKHQTKLTRTSSHLVSQPTNLLPHQQISEYAQRRHQRTLNTIENTIEVTWFMYGEHLTRVYG